MLRGDKEPTGDIRATSRLLARQDGVWQGWLSEATYVKGADRPATSCVRKAKAQPGPNLAVDSYAREVVGGQIDDGKTVSLDGEPLRLMVFFEITAVSRGYGSDSSAPNVERESSAFKETCIENTECWWSSTCFAGIEPGIAASVDATVTSWILHPSAWGETSNERLTWMSGSKAGKWRISAPTTGVSIVWLRTIYVNIWRMVGVCVLSATEVDIEAYQASQVNKHEMYPGRNSLCFTTSQVSRLVRHTPREGNILRSTPRSDSNFHHYFISFSIKLQPPRLSRTPFRLSPTLLYTLWCYLSLRGEAWASLEDGPLDIERPNEVLCHCSPSWYSMP